MSKQLILSVFIFMMVISSCKTGGGIFGNKIKSLTPLEIHHALQENQLHYQTFSSKSKIELTAPGINQSVSANIDMIRDSMIGISLRAIGVEGARILVTPDSVKVLDRLNQSYLAKAFNYISEEFGVTIGFSELQQLIAGNAIYVDTAVLTQGIADDKYVLFSASGVYKNTLWVTPDFTLSRMFIEESGTGRNLTLNYDEYDKIEGRPFAFMRTILVDAASNVTATIAFTKVTLDEPIEFSFSVNPKYKKVE